MSLVELPSIVAPVFISALASVITGWIANFQKAQRKKLKEEIEQEIIHETKKNIQTGEVEGGVNVWEKYDSVIQMYAAASGS